MLRHRVVGFAVVVLVSTASASASGRVAAPGERHTCLLTNGIVRCWGRNTVGQLGDGTTTFRTAPVTTIASGATGIASGANHNCAVTTGGAVQCWGHNTSGQVGDGTTANRLLPVSVSGLGSGIASAAAGGLHFRAVTTAGAVSCWGFNASGQLGDGTTTNRSLPVASTGLPDRIESLAGGYTFSCAVTSGGGLWCWGGNADGQLGDGTAGFRSTPVAVPALGQSAQTVIATGIDHSCFVTAGGAAQCTGSNTYGQLGDLTTTSRTAPVTVSGLGSGVAALAAGRYHTCALTTGGAVSCRGDNSEGQLGDGTTTSHLTPAGASGLDSGVLSVAAGSFHTCAITTGGAVWCWGENDLGQVGDGTTTDMLMPDDYDGDGKTDAAVYRPSSGTWYVRPPSGAAQWSVVFGAAGDVPVAGDFDGDLKADIAVYRSSTGTWFWLKSTTNFTAYEYRGWGLEAEGDTPVPGDYDGDGKTDGAIYRSSEGRWYVRPSSGAALWNVVFGAAGDVPLITIR